MEPSNLVKQDSEADPYSWAYKISANGAITYNERQEKSLYNFFYGLDQNREIEYWFGARNKIYCKGDCEVRDSTLSAEPNNKRFKLLNTMSAFERKIARFDRPCYFNKPDYLIKVD